MGASEETVRLLKSIDASLKDLVAIAKQRPRGSTSSASTGGEATDAEMDDPKWGDPTIRRDPKRWTGERMVGRRYSETSPEYLEVLATFKDWQAQQDEATNATDDKGRPKSQWARKDARIARGWAARLRAGYKPKPPPSMDDADGDDPFGDQGRFDDAF